MNFGAALTRRVRDAASTATSLASSATNRARDAASTAVRGATAEEASQEAVVDYASEPQLSISEIIEMVSSCDNIW